MWALDKNILERAWDTTKDAGTYVQDKAAAWAKAVGEAYDSVTWKTRTAKDKMVGYVQGDIAIPKASEDTHGVRPKLKAALKWVIPDDRVEQFLDQDKITNEQVETILKPALMTKVTTRSKLLDLKSAFRTHNYLRDLVDTYGIAPIDPDRKVSIPTARVKSSDLLREMKLWLSTSKATFYKSARALLWISDTDMDDISLGRHIVALKAQALAETVDAVMGRTQNSKNAENLTNKGLIFDTNGSWQEYMAWNDLAEALASTKSDHLDMVWQEAQRYSRTTLNNDYIRSLMAAAADSSQTGRSLTIMWVTQDFSEDEPEKLMQIADELEAIRQWISSVDPDIFRKTTSEVENVIKTGKDFVVAWLTIPYLAVMAVLKWWVPMVLLIAHIAHMKAGTGRLFLGNSKITKILSVALTPWYFSYWIQRSFNKQEAAPADPAELAKRQKEHLAPDDAYFNTLKGEMDKEQKECVKKISDLESEIKRLEAIKRPTKRDIAALEATQDGLRSQQKLKTELGNQHKLFHSAHDAYKKRFDNGTFYAKHDSNSGLETFFRSIRQGKITTLWGAWADMWNSDNSWVSKEEWKWVWTRAERAVRRPIEAVKRRWFTESDIVDAAVEAKTARKWAKADPLEITLPDGTKKTIKLAEVGYKTPAENLLAEIDLHYRMKKWGSLYTAYKIALGKEAKAEQSKIEARKSAGTAVPATSTRDHGATHITYDRSDIAAEVNAAAAKSKPVQDLATEMATLELGDKFDPSLLSVKIVEGEPVFDETKIKGMAFDEHWKPLIWAWKLVTNIESDGKIKFEIGGKEVTLGFLDEAKLKNSTTIEKLWTNTVAKWGLGLDKAELPNLKTMSHIKAQEAVVQKVKA